MEYGHRSLEILAKEKTCEGCCQNVRDRFGQIHRVGVVPAEYERQDKDQGNQQNEFAKDGSDDGSSGFAECCERLLAGELDAQHEHAAHVYPEGIFGKSRQLWIRGEEPDEDTREKYGYGPEAD